MSRRSIKASVAAFVTGIAGVKSVFTAQPKLAQGFEQPAVVISIPVADEERASVPARIGKKRIKHNVVLTVIWVDPSLDAISGELAFDDLLDAIDVELRQHPQLDGNPAILEAAQDYIRTKVADPRQAGKDNGNTFRVATKEFEVIEYVVG